MLRKKRNKTDVYRPQFPASDGMPGTVTPPTLPAAGGQPNTLVLLPRANPSTETRAVSANSLTLPTYADAAQISKIEPLARPMTTLPTHCVNGWKGTPFHPYFH